MELINLFLALRFALYALTECNRSGDGSNFQRGTIITCAITEINCSADALIIYKADYTLCYIQTGEISNQWGGYIQHEAGSIGRREGTIATDCIHIV